VYDYFEVLGVPPDAGSQAIRRAERRRNGGGHPDFHQGDWPAGDSAAAPARAAFPPDRTDVAVDFVDLTVLVPQLRAAFFGT
jgi:hypothetical protein